MNPAVAVAARLRNCLRLVVCMVFLAGGVAVCYARPRPRASSALQWRIPRGFRHADPARQPSLRIRGKRPDRRGRTRLRSRSAAEARTTARSRPPSPRSGFGETTPKLGRSRSRAEAGRSPEEDSIMIGQMLGPYRVLEKLGEG